MREVVPSRNEMIRYVESGLTQQQIADTHSAKTGEHISRSAIGMALGRYGLSTARAYGPRHHRSPSAFSDSGVQSTTPK